MTNEEHIEGLEVIKPFLQGVLLSEDFEGCGELDAKEVGETIDAAISALEKQIPKKPINLDTEHRNLLRRCPSCNACIVQNLSELKIDYCIRCGQAIDWSDND